VSYRLPDRPGPSALLAENLLAQGLQAEASPWFQRAYEALHADPWLARDEPERLARMRLLGGN